MNQSHVAVVFKRIPLGFIFVVVSSALAILANVVVSVGSTTLKMYLPKGLKARIDCPLTANPPLTFIVWARNSMIIDPEKTRRLSVDRYGTLTIAQVQPADEGLYTCTPYSPLDPTYSSVSIQVLVKDLPFFTLRPQPVYQRLLGQTVVMPCVAEGDPKPTIFWKKVNGRFPPKTKTLQDGGNLTIVQLSAAEQGTYECIARNAVTTIITAALLLVQTALEEYPHNISVETTFNTAKVSWLPPYVNDSQLYRYELWCQVLHAKASEEWQRFTAIPDNTTSVTIYNLLPKTSYRFKVLSNHSGKFHFSQEVVATTNAETISSGSNSWSTLVEAFTKHTIRASSVTGVLPPAPPTNLTVTQQPDGVVLRWHRPRHSPVPVEYYVIEYQLVGQWIQLAEKIPGSATQYQWKKMLPPAATYQFRILSAGRSFHSDPSAPVMMMTPDKIPANVEGARLSGDKVAGIIGGIMFVLLGIVFAILALKFRNQKQKKLPEMAYERSEEVSLNASTSINRALEGQASPLEESISILDNHAQDRHNNYELGHIQETPI